MATMPSASSTTLARTAAATRALAETPSRYGNPQIYEHSSVVDRRHFDADPASTFLDALPNFIPAGNSEFFDVFGSAKVMRIRPDPHPDPQHWFLVSYQLLPCPMTEYR